VSKIFVQENFFDKQIYEDIVNQMINTEYDPPSVDYRKALEGSFWHKHELPQGCELQTEIKKLIKNYFNHEVKEFVSPTLYTMVGASDKPRPHVDEAGKPEFQCIIYMHGPESINNGTGFYSENELNIHVGFKPNRAIFFSSDVYHTPLQWNGNGSFRYSICNFFT
jgi:hypothetical protein